MGTKIRKILLLYTNAKTSTVKISKSFDLSPVSGSFPKVEH
jgi:hypothetical protein